LEYYKQSFKEIRAIAQQLVSNIALPQAQHKATSPTRKPLVAILQKNVKIK
jgi:hypothetical protein